jgi:hypothetical protein
MFINQILLHTPTWVFALFAALLWLGTRQLFTRSVKLSRLVLMAVGMTGFSLYGTVSAFPHQPLVLLPWAAVALAAFVWMLTRPLPVGVRYDAWQGRFLVPGSWVPLALMMGIFFTKYAVGASLAMQPLLAGSLSFALPVGALYGFFSGMFAARAGRLLRLALQGQHASVGALSA